MITLFISDIHLQAKQPKIVQIFVDFLIKEASEAQNLYILGDLFEAWIGDDDHNRFIQLIKNSLHYCHTQGTNIYLMHGNRDFLLSQAFAQACGAQFLPDPCLINLYGIPTLLTHGDCLCTDDQAYFTYRTKARSRDFQAFVQKKPLWCRQFMARYYRWLSQYRQKNNAQHIIDVNHQTVIRMMEQYQVAQLIHGHTHQPALHYFQHNGRWLKRIVLSDWHHTGNVLRTAPAEQSLINFG
jgi:UDP-2,3-diacylglucosamine hydrolase